MLHYSSLWGLWKNQVDFEGMAVTTVQQLSEDGTFETRMTYHFENGCQQTVVHRGQYQVADGQLYLSFVAGKTAMTGCPDAQQNFSERPFNAAEMAEAQALLSQAIPYKMSANRLVTTVRTGDETLQIAYDRISDSGL